MIETIKQEAERLSQKVINGMGGTDDFDKGMKAGAEVWTKFGYETGAKDVLGEIEMILSSENWKCRGEQLSEKLKNRIKKLKK